MSKVGKVIANFIAIAAVAFVLGVIGLFSSIFFMAPETMYIIRIIITLYVFILVLFTFKLFGWTKHATGKKAFYGVTAVIFVTALFFVIPSIYKQTLEKVAGDVDLNEYAPFEKGTKAVKLDEPTKLKLESELPILDGATALYPMYAAFAQAVYPEKDYQLYDSAVMCNNTGNAYEQLINGQVDVIFVAGPSDNQLAMAKQAGKELKLTPIGKESFVFFVNSKNKVKGLTIDEIKRIYSGEITNWKDVGGKKKSIRAFQRPEDSGSQTALQKLMGDTPIMDPPVDNVVDLMSGIIDEVATYQNYNNAIGYTFRYYSTEMVGNDKIRLLEVDGVEPNIESIRSGTYPITAEFYAVTAGSSNPHVEELIEWVLSDQGQRIVEETGYVSIKE